MEPLDVRRGSWSPRRPGSSPASSAARWPTRCDLDVVGVAVPAVVVVDGEHVGSPRRAGWRPAARRPRRRRPARSTPGSSLVGSPIIPESVVAEELRPARHAEDLGGDRWVSTTRRSHSCLAVGEHAGDGLALLAPGADHEHDPVAGRGRLGHGAAGGDGLVVGVGVEADERRHGGTLPSPRRPASQAPPACRPAQRSAGRQAMAPAARSSATRSARRRPSRPGPRRCAGRRGRAVALISPGVRREARRRRRLHDAAATSTKVSRATLCGCVGASPMRQHRGEADVGALDDRAPLVAGLGAEDAGEALLQWPATGAVVLPGARRSPARGRCCASSSA